VRLVTPTVKRALTNTEQHLHDTNCTITVSSPRPDPLTTDELVNELSPAPRTQH
jgi:hypothetical protein